MADTTLGKWFDSCKKELTEECSSDVVMVIVALVIILVLVLMCWHKAKTELTLKKAATERMRQARIVRGNYRERLALPYGNYLSNSTTPSSMGRKQMNDQANLDYTSRVSVGDPVVVGASNFGYVTREMGSGGSGANPVGYAAGLQERMNSRLLAQDLNRERMFHGPASLDRAYMERMASPQASCPPLVWSPYLNEFVPDRSKGYKGNVWADAYTQAILTGDTSGLKELYAI